MLLVLGINAQLSNSNRFMSYREAYLQLPMVMTLTTDGFDAAGTQFLPALAGTSCDYVCGLKNWFGSMIHSIQVDWNGVTELLTVTKVYPKDMLVLL